MFPEGAPATMRNDGDLCSALCSDGGDQGLREKELWAVYTQVSDIERKTTGF